MTELGNLRKRAAYILYGKGWAVRDIAAVLDQSPSWVYGVLADLRRAQVQCDRDQAAYDRELAG